MDCTVLPWKIARKFKGLSQGELARRAQVDQSHLSKVASGKYCRAGLCRGTVGSAGAAWCSL
ncbi:helix-turn-helix domain-containing protein [Sulfobacillus harzensis]|uniref:helix-turn-helix domain-containing protein n=1 Tax=Sulfobacillus harzensis TaxID=2729629 RepID=UPI003B8342A0